MMNLDRNEKLLQNELLESKNKAKNKKKYLFPEMRVTRKIFTQAAANFFLTNLTEFLK